MRLRERENAVERRREDEGLLLERGEGGGHVVERERVSSRSCQDERGGNAVRGREIDGCVRSEGE